MIECIKIEDFVITQMFRPYMPSLLPGEFQGLEYCEEQEKIEQKLRSHPKYIIDILEKTPETKRRIFNRLWKCGGVKFYRYLDMSNPVIQYVKKGLEERFKSFQKEIDRMNVDTPDIYIGENSISAVCPTCGYELISNLKQSNHAILICPKCGQVTVLKN